MGIIQKTNTNKLVNDDKARREYWEQQFGTSYQIGTISSENKTELTRIVQGLPVGKMLDNGCGDGRLKKFYEDLGWETYGTDISANAIKRASEVSPLNLICCPSENLPFKDEFFNVVLSWRVLHSLDKAARKLALTEIARVLAKGGVLLCSVQSLEDTHTLEKYKSNGIDVIEDNNSFVTDMDVEGKVVQRLKHFFSKDNLIEEFEAGTGLKVQRIESYTEKSGWNKDNQTYWLVKAIKLSY